MSATATAPLPVAEALAAVTPLRDQAAALDRRAAFGLALAFAWLVAAALALACDAPDEAPDDERFLGVALASIAWAIARTVRACVLARRAERLTHGRTEA